MKLTLDTLEGIFQDVIQGKMSFEEASIWAFKMMRKDDFNDLEYNSYREEEKISSTFTFFLGLDLTEPTGEYFHSIENVKDEYEALFGPYKETKKRKKRVVVFMKKKLSFEYSEKDKLLEIHADKEGLIFLKEQIDNLIKVNDNDHIHMMIESWGGEELSKAVQSHSKYKQFPHVQICKQDS